MTYPMINKMIVTIGEYGESCVFLRLFDREKRNSQRFLLLKSSIRDMLQLLRSMDDTDLNNTIRLQMKDNGLVDCRINFISIDAANHITGYRRCFDVPRSVFEAAMDGVTSRILVDFEERPHTPRFTLSDSVHRAVGKMDKVKCRALVKALISRFCNDEVVTVSKDFGEDFFFEEKHPDFSCSICGGLCLHSSTIRGNDGVVREKLVFSKHT